MDEKIFEQINRFWKLNIYISLIIITCFLIFDGLIFINTFNFSYAMLKSFYMESMNFSLTRILLFFLGVIFFESLFFVIALYTILKTLNYIDTKIEMIAIYIILLVLLYILYFKTDIHSFYFEFLIVLFLTIYSYTLLFRKAKIIIKKYKKEGVIVIILVGYLIAIIMCTFVFILNQQYWKYTLNSQKSSLDMGFKNTSLNLLLNPLFLQQNHKDINIDFSKSDKFSKKYYSKCLHQYKNNFTQKLDINSSAYLLSLSQINKLYFKKNDSNGICIYAVQVIPFKDKEFYKLIDIGYVFMH